jgi:hypothetical protein
MKIQTLLLLLVMDYTMPGGNVIMTSDRDGRNTRVILKTNLDLTTMMGRDYQFRLAKCAEGHYFFDPVFDTVYTISTAGEVYPRCTFLHGKSHIATNELNRDREMDWVFSGRPMFRPRKVLPDGSALTFLDPWNDINHYLEYVFKQRELFNPGAYDVSLFQKLSDYGNPVLMFVK